jgi:hypothetical protein
MMSASVKSLFWKINHLADLMGRGEPARPARIAQLRQDSAQAEGAACR